MKNAFFNPFYFLVANYFYPSKPAKILLKPHKLLHKRLLSDGFNMAAITNFLMKSCSPQTCHTY